ASTTVRLLVLRAISVGARRRVSRTGSRRRPVLGGRFRKGAGDDEVSLLSRRQRQGGRYPRGRRRLHHPSSASVRLVRPPLHHLRTSGRVRSEGGQEERRARGIP